MVFIGLREDIGREPSHPAAWSEPTPLCSIAPDVVASRSQRINPWADASRSSVTICKTMFAGMFRTADGIRCPTPREMARIGSFPDQFKFLGVQRNAWARVGNSVPPLLMRSIARHVRALIA